jgi:hypothetical protein
MLCIAYLLTPRAGDQVRNSKHRMDLYLSANSPSFWSLDFPDRRTPAERVIIKYGSHRTTVLSRG